VTYRLGATALLLTALALPAGAQPITQVNQATDLAGVRYEPAISLGGAPLLLNGAGVRYKAIFKVYTAGLYLGTKAATPEAVLATTGAKRLQVVMLREIDANELGKLFTRGMQDNAPRDEFIKCIPGTIRFGEIFAAKRKLLPGESFSLDWLPGSGTVVRVNGKPAGEAIPEPEFYNGLLRIWLGKSPADWQLKDALLGKAPGANRIEH
jgi:hypothetical protein